MKDPPFQLDYELQGRIASRSPCGQDGRWATLESATELDVDVVYTSHDKVGSRRFLLRKRGEEAADR